MAEPVIPTLEAITAALTCDLQEHYRSVQVMRNGATQITLFLPGNFIHAQIVVGLGGVYLVVDPTKDVPESEVPENLRGPYPLEDPKMFSYLYSAIDQWLKSHRN